MLIFLQSFNWGESERTNENQKHQAEKVRTGLTFPQPEKVEWMNVRFGSGNQRGGAALRFRQWFLSRQDSPTKKQQDLREPWRRWRGRWYRWWRGQMQKGLGRRTWDKYYCTFEKWVLMLQEWIIIYILQYTYAPLSHDGLLLQVEDFLTTLLLLLFPKVRKQPRSLVRSGNPGRRQRLS